MMNDKQRVKQNNNIMQYFFIFLLVFSFFSCSTIQNTSLNQTDITAIQTNFDQQAACWNKGDLECYVKAYYPSENVQTISRVGVTKGYDNILASYQKYFPKDKMGQLHFDNFSYKKLNKQYIYVVGRFNLKYENEEKLRQGWFSVLMEKIEGEWYMMSDHSS